MPITPESFPSIQPVPLKVFEDERGKLWKALTAADLGGKPSLGEIYLISFRPGAVRGNHFHQRTREWFLCVKGRIRCRLALPGTSLRSEMVLDEEKPAILEVPPGVAHCLCPDGEEPPLLLAYADREYDKEAPDVAPYPFD